VRAAGLHLGWGNGNGNPGGNGNGKGGGAQCFLRGTAILTDCGEKPVEDLRVGDNVAFPDGSTRPVKWSNGSAARSSRRAVRAGMRASCRSTFPATRWTAAHHIRSLPVARPLFLNGVLIRVRDLVNGTTIAPVVPADDTSIEYYAVLLSTHELILAEGAAAETFHPSENNHVNFSNFAECKRLYAEERTVMTSYATVVGEEGVWQHLKALLLLGASPLVPMRDPFGDACEKINAQIKELSV